MWKIFKVSSLFFVSVGVCGTLLYIFWQVIPGLDHASPIFAKLPSLNLVILLVHVYTAVPPLLLGIPALIPRVRNYSFKAHRWMGTVYCISIWISAVTGIMLASANQVSIFSKLGFGLLGVMWFTTTTFAYLHGKGRKLVTHREWMIRSYSLTFAVVTVRPMFWFPPENIDGTYYYILVSWICWVPNLICAEIYIRSTTFKGKLKPHIKSLFSSSFWLHDEQPSDNHPPNAPKH